MARHFRRLILGFLAGIATLAVLVLCALAWIWWFLDPDDYRVRIEARASESIGRAVRLGHLRWQLGRQIFIVSEGGDIANAAGFGAEPMARWSRIRLGVAARPLFDKRVLIDRVEIDGLQLSLQRNAQGAGNWLLQLPQTNAAAAAQPVTLRIADAVLRDSAIRFQDAVSGADWRVSKLNASVKLPDDLNATDRQFRDVDLAGVLAGGPLPETGVAFALRTQSLRVSPQVLEVPKFNLHWADAVVDGSIAAQLGAELRVDAKLDLQVPSLRALLATAAVTLPPMRDPATLAAMNLSVQASYAGGAMDFRELSLSLDDTHLTGEVSLPRSDPLSLRFTLAADRIDLDRYLQPDDASSEPFELPLAYLKSLDAKGSLRIGAATVAGAVAKDVRLDVE